MTTVAPQIVLIFPDLTQTLPDLRSSECFIKRSLYKDPQAPENVG